MKRVLILLLFVSSLFSLNFAEFDRSFDSANRATKEKFHSELKKEYITSSSRVEILKRLVHSSKALGYNFEGYERELNSLGSSYQSYLNSKNSLKSSQISKSSEAKKIEPKKVETKKDEIKKIEPKSQKPKQEPKKDSSKKESIKKDEPKKAEIPKQNLEKSSQSSTKNSAKTSYSNAPLRLINLLKSDDGVEIVFNRALKDDEFKKFALSGESYRNVIDFKAINASKVTTIENHLNKRVRVAQFDPKTTRVVISDDKKFSINLGSDKNIVFVAFGAAKTTKPSQTASNSKAPVKQARQKIIVIDPGHGGKDPGAMANRLREKDIVLNIGKDLGYELSKRGYKIFYTRQSDKFINLKSRTAFANKKNADLFISIHINAGPNTKSGRNLSGVETFFLSPARSERSKNAAALENKGDIEDMNHFSKETYLNFLNREKIIASNKLAIDIQKHMLNMVHKKYSMKDGGVREAPFWVLVGATMPAILIEAGYITNSNDSKQLAKREYQKAVANGIANGIDAYFLKNN